MINRKLLVAVAASSLLAALWPTMSFAADSNRPVPGTASCHGDFVGSVSSNGLGNPAQHAAAIGTTVQELQERIQAFCGQP